MSIIEKDNRVDEYIRHKAQDWQEPYAKELRKIIDECPIYLNETIKWGAPVYVGKRNVAGIVALKNHISLWLYEGALLEDPNDVLYQASEKTKALRQVRFEEGAPLPGEDVADLIHQAAEKDKKGLKVTRQKVQKPKTIPSPLKDLLEENPDAKKVFDDLAPSHQKEYVDYINEAKQAKTKQSRAIKAIDLLSEGKGLHDKYKP